MARRGGAALASDEQMLFTRKGEVRVMSKCNASQQRWTRAPCWRSLLLKIFLFYDFLSAPAKLSAYIAPRASTDGGPGALQLYSSARGLISCGNATSKQAATMRRSRLRV